MTPCANDRPILGLHGISHDYQLGRRWFGTARRLRVLDQIDLAIEPGEVLAVVGESGSGKTTLVRVMLGQLRPGSGRVELCGQALAGMDRRTIAGYLQPVFQDPYGSLNPRHRIGRIIGMPLLLAGVSAADRHARVADWMARIGLPVTLIDAFPGQLSGGQRQRVAIARALIGGPRLLICDEPTSALDVSIQAQILNLLKDLHQRLGLTVVIVTHNLAVVRQMASRVAVMYRGRIVEAGPADRVFAQPAHPYTRVLLAAALTPEPGAGLPELPPVASAEAVAVRPETCLFLDRCSAAIPVCRSLPPPRVALAETLVVECHHPAGVVTGVHLGESGT